MDETRYRSEEITPGPVNENTNKLKEQRNRNMLGNRGDMLTMPIVNNFVILFQIDILLKLQHCDQVIKFIEVFHCEFHTILVTEFLPGNKKLTTLP